MSPPRLSCTAILAFTFIATTTSGAIGCTGLTLSSSTSERNACLSEEVTFTCTAQGEAVFWENEEFGEITIHFQSAPTSGEFYRVIVVDYDSHHNCLVSSLTFRATASRNGTRVTCTSRDRNSHETLSLHIIPNIVLENLAVVPESLSSVFLEWDVNPTDGYQCISSYNIQVTSQNGSQWGAQISGMNSSFLLSGLNLVPLEAYTYCVTANVHPSQVGPSVNHVSSVELHEPHPPTNITTTVYCRQGYEIEIDWQAPLPAPLGSPLIGYLLHYHINGNESIIKNVTATSCTLSGIPPGSVCNITVSALSNAGPSKNNTSIQFAVPSLMCKDSLTPPGGSRLVYPSFFIQALTKINSTSLEDACVVDNVTSMGCNCTNHLLEELLEDNSVNNSLNQSCVGLPTKNTFMDSITICGITAFTSGVIAFSCGVLIAIFCNYIIIRKHKAVKKCKENEVSKHPAAVSPFYLQQSDQSPEIPMQEHSQGHNVELQQNEVSKHSSAVSPLYPQRSDQSPLYQEIQQSDQSPLYQEIPMQEHSQGHVVELQQNIAYVSQGQIHADLNS